MLLRTRLNISSKLMDCTAGPVFTSGSSRTILPVRQSAENESLRSCRTGKCPGSIYLYGVPSNSSGDFTESHDTRKPKRAARGSEVFFSEVAPAPKTRRNSNEKKNRSESLLLPASLNAQCKYHLTFHANARVKNENWAQYACEECGNAVE
jgi:hypothetical protein